MLRRAAAAIVVAAVIIVLVWPGHLEAGVAHEAQNAAGGVGVPNPTVTDAINIAEVVGNVLLFVPVGLAVAFASRHWWTGVVVGFLLSCVCETAQAFLPARHASLVDVAANSLGAAVGALAVLGLRVQRRRWRMSERAGHASRAR